MEEINNFQQESDETLYQAWERFKELLMKCPQHYLTKMQEAILFYNGLEVPTRQILTSKGAIPTNTVADAKVAIQEMAKYSQKWHNDTSRTRSTETSNGLEGRAAAPGFYQRNNANPSYQEQRQSMEESLSKFMSESTKRHEENSNLIKEIRPSIDAAIRNQGALIKTLEIQIGQMSKKGSYRPQILEASHIDNFMPQKEKDPRSFTLPCYINNVCFDNALADLGASVSVMPLSTYLNLGLGELAHTKLIVKLADKTMKYPKGIAENVLVGIVPLILKRILFSTAHAKIDVFKRNISLRVGEVKIICKSVKPASCLIKRVYMLSLRERMELDLEARLMGETLVLNRSIDSLYGDYIELNDLNVPLELRRDQVDELMPTIEEGEVIEEVKARNDNKMVSDIFGYPSDYDHDEKIRIDCAYNLKFHSDEDVVESCMSSVVMAIAAGEKITTADYNLFKISTVQRIQRIKR
ncbi:mitochondrial proton/calcium exchanger protein-like protein isoform X1 [Tanacetum coccineum]